MSDTFQPVKYSPLSDLPAPLGGIVLEERAHVGKINLRGNPGDPEFLAAVERALGTVLPLGANTTSVSEQYTCFWLGPDEWLIHCAEETQAATREALEESLRGKQAAITDVTDYYVIIRITGDKAREVMSKGTPFDLYPGVFKRGRCAQTCFGHATILLHHPSDVAGYDIQVRWSFAEYLWNFLVDGTREYGGG